jgi:hypothetical protein
MFSSTVQRTVEHWEDSCVGLRGFLFVHEFKVLLKGDKDYFFLHPFEFNTHFYATQRSHWSFEAKAHLNNT